MSCAYPKLLPKPKNAKVHDPRLCEHCSAMKVSSKRAGRCIIQLDKDLTIPCINIAEDK